MASAPAALREAHVAGGLRDLAAAERKAARHREQRLHVQYQAQVRRVSYNRPEDGFEYQRSLCPGESFFQFLAPWPDSARDAKRTRHERLKVWIPDTVVYGGADGPLWFYSDREGYVHSTYKFSDKHVVSKLGNNRYEYDLVAVRKESSLKPHNANPNVVAAQGNALRLLTTKELRDVTSQTTGAGNGGDSFVLQKFIKSRGSKPSIVRSEYRNEYPTVAWTISNRATFDEPSSDLVSRFCTTPHTDFCCNVIPLRGAACQATAEITERMVAYLERHLARIFDVLVADYIRDDLGQWWFLQVKAFKLRGAQPGRPLPLAEGVRRRLHLDRGGGGGGGGGGEGGGNSASAQGTAMGTGTATATGGAHKPPSARAEIKHQRLASCRSCLAPYPPSELQYKMTMKMVCDTMDHIRARLPASQHHPWLSTAQRRHQSADPALQTVGCESSFMYTPHRVCKLCYELYQQEHRLKLLERKYALAIGVQAAAHPRAPAAPGAGTGTGTATTVARPRARAKDTAGDAAERLLSIEADQWLGRDQQLDLVPVSPRSLPRQLTLCRILVMLHQVHDLPRRFLSPDSRLVVRYKIFTDEEVSLLGKPLGDDDDDDDDDSGDDGHRHHGHGRRARAQPQMKMLRRRVPSRQQRFDEDDEDEEDEVPHEDDAPGVVLPINRMRVFHFFAENTPVDAPLSEHSTLADFLSLKRHITVELLSVPASAVSSTAGGTRDSDEESEDVRDDDTLDERERHRRRRLRTERLRRAAQDDGVALVAPGDVDFRHAVRLGEARLPLKDFRSAVVNKMTHVATCGCALVRATVGVERTRVVADPQVFADQGHSFQYQTGIYVPDESFFTCDPLPAEWVGVAPDPAADPGAARFEVPSRLAHHYRGSPPQQSSGSDSGGSDDDSDDGGDGMDELQRRRKKKKKRQRAKAKAKELSETALLALSRAPVAPTEAERAQWPNSIWVITLLLHRTHNLAANPKPSDRWYAEYDLFGRACRVNQRPRSDAADDEAATRDPLERSIAFDSTQRHYVRCSLEALQMYVIQQPWLSIRVRRDTAGSGASAEDAERDAFACHVNLRGLPAQRTIDGTFDFTDESGHTQPLSGQLYPPYLSLSMYIFRQGPQERSQPPPLDMKVLFRTNGIEVLEKQPERQ